MVDCEMDGFIPTPFHIEPWEGLTKKEVDDYVKWLDGLPSRWNWSRWRDADAPTRKRLGARGLRD